MREEWIKAVRRTDYTPSKTAVLCSKHFQDTDFFKTSASKVQLIPGAVPTIFTAFPSYLQTKATKRKPPKERCSLEASTIPSQPVPDAAEQNPVSTAINPPGPSATSPDKESLKRKLEKAEAKLCSSRKKIKLLQQARRRLIKKNASLKSVISELRRHNLVSSNSIDILEKCSGGVADLLQRQVIIYINFLFLFVHVFSRKFMVFYNIFKKNLKYLRRK